MGTILFIREIASDDGLNSQYIEIVGRDAPVMHVLHVRTGLEIHARGP